VVALDAQLLGKGGEQLFGRGKHRGLLAWLGEGTLILTNIHKAKPELMIVLSQYLGPNASQHSLARFVFTAEKPVAWLAEVSLIKVPPLRLRIADVQQLTKRFVRRAARRRSLNQLMLTQPALWRLESYSFPNNVTELEAIVERAVAQADPQATELTGEMFWFAAPGRDQSSTNLLVLPWLKALLRSGWWPEKLNFRIIAPAYAVILIVLFLGPQARNNNVVLTVFWSWWWAGSLLVYPFLGRIWCSVCPFMIYGELVQRWRLNNHAVLRKWPRAQVEKWGPWFLLSLFAIILTWEEVWDLHNSAAASASLLLLITAGAMTCSWVFERRLWCRFLCPIGGMNGMFAKLSMTEVRALPGVCAGNCDTYHCLKGGPAELPEGQETAGCPIHSHPAHLIDNKDCTLCMTCLKACPHDSVQLRLRPPGLDLWSGHAATAGEVCLMFLLLGAAFLHHIPAIVNQFRLDPTLMDQRCGHLAVTVFLLAAPGAAVWALDAATRQLQGSKLAPLVELAYSYLPLVWAGNLAFWLGMLFAEGGTLLPVAARTVGFGAAASWLPSWQANVSVASFVRHVVLLGGLASSLTLLRRLGRAEWPSLSQHAAAMVLCTAELWYLIP
jgi:polyferredoxin